MAVTLRGTTVRNETAIEAWNPIVLFANNEPGAWYAPNDIPVNWRRNLLTYTEQFDNAAWAKTSISVASDVEVAPDGTSTADLVSSTSTSTAFIYNNTAVSVVPGTDYIVSIYIKAGPNFATGRIRAMNGAISTTFLDTTVTWSGGVPSVGSGSVTSVGSGWYRYTGVANTGVDTTLRLLVYPSNSALISKDIYIWGAQVERGSTASAYQQIVTPAISFLTYQPQPVMFQESTGVTPVTAVEQAVGLILDKSRGLVLGPELVTNGDFSNGTTGWKSAATLVQDDTFMSVTGGVMRLTNTTGSAADIRLRATTSATVVVGRTYIVTIQVVRAPSTGIRLSFNDSNTAFGATGDFQNNVTAAGTYTFYHVAATTAFSVIIRSQIALAAADYYEVDNISVRELSGTHRIQPGATNRPILRARYNLLTYSEQFDNAAWTKARVNVTQNATAAPDGTTTADKLVATSVSGTHRVLANASKPTQTQTMTFNCYIKAAEYTFAMVRITDSTETDLASCAVNLSTGEILTAASGFTGVSGSATNVGNGWWLVAVTATTDAESSMNAVVFIQTSLSTSGSSFTGNDSDGIFVWGADLRRANDTYLPYQWINAATDYNTVGFPVYLSYDGSDDGMYTGGNLDLSATDKVTVFAGVTKLSDATLAPIAELGTGSGDGVFFLFAPRNDATANIGWRSRGTATAEANTAASFAAPLTTVLTATGDIAGDSALLRSNGVQVASSTNDQGTGNFGSYVLNVGRRNNATLPFNGREYQTLIVGRLCTADESTRMERYTAETQGRNL